jgi:hypothetical protein
MEALRETTDWKYPNHVYLVDGTNLVAYIKKGTKVPFYFSKPITAFSRSGRTFVKATLDLFEQKQNPSLIEVKGSKGNTYWVDPEEKTCTCLGFTYRGKCKHIENI